MVNSINTDRSPNGFLGLMGTFFERSLCVSSRVFTPAADLIVSHVLKDLTCFVSYGVSEKQNQQPCNGMRIETFVKTEELL